MQHAAVAEIKDGLGNVSFTQLCRRILCSVYCALALTFSGFAA